MEFQFVLQIRDVIYHPHNGAVLAGVKFKTNDVGLANFLVGIPMQNPPLLINKKEVEKEFARLWSQLKELEPSLLFELGTKEKQWLVITEASEIPWAQVEAGKYVYISFPGWTMAQPLDEASCRTFRLWLFEKIRNKIATKQRHREMSKAYNSKKASA